jgi:hypothetical protein
MAANGAWVTPRPVVLALSTGSENNFRRRSARQVNGLAARRAAAGTSAYPIALALRDNRGMKKQTLTPPPAEDAAESLLRGPIGECHAMIREQVRPSYGACEDPYRRGSHVQRLSNAGEGGV